MYKWCITGSPEGACAGTLPIIDNHLPRVSVGIGVLESSQYTHSVSPVFATCFKNWSNTAGISFGCFREKSETKRLKCTSSISKINISQYDHWNSRYKPLRASNNSSRLSIVEVRPANRTMKVEKWRTGSDDRMNEPCFRGVSLHTIRL